MNFLILHAHWNNRGDEAALRAMVDNILEIYPESQIRVQLISDVTEQFPATSQLQCFPTCLNENSAWRRKRLLDFFIALISKGKFVHNEELKTFWKYMNWCDVVIHAPGGPSIGEIYREHERFYLLRLLCAIKVKKPYMFYAPSAGPFYDKKRNVLRRYIYNQASDICLRESISAGYVKKLGINKEITVTLDSAMQRDIDSKTQLEVLNNYESLKLFLNQYEKIVGITISDLTWNSIYQNNDTITESIRTTFTQFIAYLREQGYGVIFIPQLFGKTNDKNYMSEYMLDNCFILDDTHDCYFQQYIIGRLYAVVGMRYHSNVFSAKMETPFISISYEQKMKGFMELTDLYEYCIDVNNLNLTLLKEKFELLNDNYHLIKKQLHDNHDFYKAKSYETTKHLMDLINKKQRG